MVHTQEPAVRTAERGESETVTGWVGWILFAGVIMFTGGIFNVIEGLVALMRDDFYLVGSSGLVVNVDYTAYGWVLLAIGALLVFGGYSLMTGQTWARVLAVILAVINATLHMLFMPAYPIWSVIAITLDVFVIYALVVHGGEMKYYKEGR
ncbi:DUF7144 family membrane protein [Actinoplanes solisilvae]|uniref:DUF7144 family membrane protein n=1 Tax=Actinoplanes solisilvae TaxID=2486853 RepID=UPI000FD8B8C4|nr:hypothetical protein [Actinoplanes solisilvae]